MNTILGGIIAIVAGAIIWWLIGTIKAMKDPDVQAASNLKMSITRFHLYQRLWNEYQDYMKVHGIHSRDSEEKFKEIFKQIPNPNEWRRFGQYMEQKGREKMMNEIYKNFK